MSAWNAYPDSRAPHPGFFGAGENAKPGMLGATTWKAGEEALGGLRRPSRILPTSMKLPGQPWMKSKGMASVRLERWWIKWRGTGLVKLDLGPVETKVVKCLYLEGESVRCSFVWGLTYKIPSVQLILDVKPFVVVHPVIPYGAHIMSWRSVR